MTDPDFESRVATLLHRRAGTISANDRLGEITSDGRPDLRPAHSHRAPRPRQRPILVVVGALVALSGITVAYRSMASSGRESDVIVTDTAGSLDLPAATDSPDNRLDLYLWMDPGATTAQHEAVRARIDAAGNEVGYVFIDQNLAYDEFAARFADMPELVETVTPDILPTSYRLTFTAGASFDPLRRDLEGLAGVLRVWPAPIPGCTIEGESPLRRVPSDVPDDLVRVSASIAPDGSSSTQTYLRTGDSPGADETSRAAQIDVTSIDLVEPFTTDLLSETIRATRPDAVIASGSVRGCPAVVAFHSSTEDDTTDPAVEILVYEGEGIVSDVTTRHLARSEAVAIAASMTPVDEASFDTSFQPTETGTVEPDRTTATTTSTAPAPG